MPPVVRDAKFHLGQVVRHRLFPFRGVIFDVDPEFANTEDWWLAIPEEVRPAKDLVRDMGDATYPVHGTDSTRAPAALASATVPSVEPVSTTRTSSAQRTDSSDGPSRSASSFTLKTTETGGRTGRLSSTPCGSSPSTSAASGAAGRVRLCTSRASWMRGDTT